jgi:hypothetical protein
VSNPIVKEPYFPWPSPRESNRNRAEAIVFIAAATWLVGWLTHAWIKSSLMRSIVVAAMGM